MILHPSMPIIGKFDRIIDALSGTQASVYVDDHLVDRGYALESMSAPPVYAALMSPGSALHTFSMVQSFRNLAGFGVMLVDTPSPDNRLVLDDTGEPRIQYQLSEADKQRFRQGIAEAVRVMFLAGAKEVYLPTTENILDASQASQLQPVVLTNIHQADQIERNLRFIPNRSIVTSAHMQAPIRRKAWSPVTFTYGELKTSMSSTEVCFQRRWVRIRCRVSIHSLRFLRIA
jgi:hypothetical protein